MAVTDLICLFAPHGKDIIRTESAGTPLCRLFADLNAVLSFLAGADAFDQPEQQTHNSQL